MQINPLSHLFKNFRLPDHKPSLPIPTPIPERNKVVGDPTRVPVNKQAAMLLSPIRSWLSQPLPPEKLKTPQDHAIELLQSELKVERNNHAETRDALGNTRTLLRESRNAASAMSREIDRLRTELREKEDIIRQLEDIKL